jgi:hypothetical protein
VKNVDPDGRVVTLSNSGDSNALQASVVAALQRPDARATIIAVANDKNFNAAFGDALIMPQAVIQYRFKTRGAADVTFGSTTKHLDIGNGKVAVTGSDSQIDTKRIATYHADKTGVTTLMHEFDHVQAIRSGKDPADGDRPTSAKGPAEKEGQRMAAQPADLTEQQAQQLFQSLVLSGAVKTSP